MSAMAAPPPPAPRLDSVPSFSDAALPAEAVAEPASPPAAFSDAGSDTDADADFEFEFAFAPPLSPRAGTLAPADDLFAHGRILTAYPLFDRRHFVADDHDEAASASSRTATSSSSTAPPSPDTYCAWAPRSAPGSPSRERDPPAAAAAFPKSASTGEARRFWRLRDLVSGGGGRSHSDGREKFVFLQSSDGKEKHAAATAKAATAAAAPLQKQGKKKKQGTTSKAAGATTEMDMATAHRLFYGKPGGASAVLAGDRPRQPQSYLPYRPGIVGFFATAHALGRSHHPY